MPALCNQAAPVDSTLPGLVLATTCKLLTRGTCLACHPFGLRLKRGNAHNCRLYGLARSPAKRSPALVRLASPGTTLQAQLPAAIRIACAIRMAVAIAMAIELVGAPVVASRFPYPGFRPTGRLTPAVLWGFAPIPPRYPNDLIISC